MKTHILGMALALAAACPMPGQTKMGGECPLITLPEATAILGTGTKAEPLVSSGKNKVCTFRNGSKSLRLSAGEVGMPQQYLKMQYEKLRQAGSGKLEPGFGDYAASYVEGDDGATFVVIRGSNLHSLSTSGVGTSAAVFDKLRGLMKTILTR
jgi:hypothetical protein